MEPSILFPPAITGMYDTSMPILKKNMLPIVLDRRPSGSVMFIFPKMTEALPAKDILTGPQYFANWNRPDTTGGLPSKRLAEPYRNWPLQPGSGGIYHHLWTKFGKKASP